MPSLSIKMLTLFLSLGSICCGIIKPERHNSRGGTGSVDNIDLERTSADNPFATEDENSGVLNYQSADFKACPTDSVFKTHIQPIIEKNCLSCHGEKALASSYMTLRSQAKQSDAALVNWNELRKRLDVLAPAKSLVLQKISNSITHGENKLPVLPIDGTNYKNMEMWVNSEVQCFLQGTNTNVVRASSGAFLLRYTKLFPTVLDKRNKFGDYLGPIDPKNFGVFSSTGLFRSIAQVERPISTVAQAALRSTNSRLCTEYLDRSLIKSTLFDLHAVLLPGEEPPANPSLRLALAAARNAWLYPYGANDPEVQRLAKVHEDAKATLSETTADQILCLVALSAPQFWFSNAGSDDAVRRVAIEVARTVPKMSDFIAYRLADDKKQFLRKYVESLQTSTETRQGYLNAVSDWHREWLGLTNAISGKESRSAPNQGGGANGLPGLGVRVVPSSESGFTDLRTVEMMGQYNNIINEAEFSEICETGKAQAFDPTTSRLLWEHWNPITNTWEAVGEWRKGVDGQWSALSGEITLADGSKRATTLADITNAFLSTDKKFHYQSGNLVGTPVDGFLANSEHTSGGPRANRQRRVRRFADDGTEQNGSSEMSLWYSGERVRVCNTLSRFVYTCTYRGSITPGLAKETPWSAMVATPQFGATGTRRDSFAHPDVLEGYRCGVPDVAMIANSGKPEYNDLLAYPPGAKNQVNDIALYLSDGNLGPDVGDLNPEQYPELVSVFAESRAKGRLIKDLREEPYYLVRYLVGQNLDYRELLTASYTYGRAELDLYYRTSGLFLPFYPSNYVRPATETDALSLRRIESSTLPSYTLAQITSGYGCLLLRDSSCGTVQYNYARQDLYIADYLKTGEISGRVMSGVLTQAAFLGPVARNGGKARSFAARVFTRLLCGLPNEFLDQLDSSAEQLHQQYIPRNETKSGDHVDPSKGCYSCHISLDPMASIFSRMFLLRGGVSSQSFGELQPAVTLHENFFYGLRGGGAPAEGAFMGKKIRGLRELGSALANSRQFAECTVRKAFENIFGRVPQGDDFKLIKDVSTGFISTSGYNYNKMVQDLISSDLFIEVN